MPDILSKLNLETEAIVLEYSQLSALNSLSDREADRLGEILNRAIDDEFLSLLLENVDYCLGHSLGLLDESSRNSYKNQQALLREHFDNENFDLDRAKSFASNFCSQENNKQLDESQPVALMYYI